MKVSVTSTGSLTDTLDDSEQAADPKAQKDVGKTMAGIGRRVILEAALRRRGTLSMSGFKIKRLGASAKIYATPTSTTVILKAKPAGPWAIVERGTIRGSPAFHTWSLATVSADAGDLDRAIEATFDKAMEV